MDPHGTENQRPPVPSPGWGLIAPETGDTNQSADAPFPAALPPGCQGRAHPAEHPVSRASPSPRGPRGGGCLPQTSLTLPLSFPPAEPEGSGAGPAGTGTPTLLRGKRGGHTANYRIVAPRSRNERG